MFIGNCYKSVFAVFLLRFYFERLQHLTEQSHYIKSRTIFVFSFRASHYQQTQASREYQPLVTDIPAVYTNPYS